MVDCTQTSPKSSTRPEILFLLLLLIFPYHTIHSLKFIFNDIPAYSFLEVFPSLTLLDRSLPENLLRILMTSNLSFL